MRGGVNVDKDFDERLYDKILERFKQYIVSISCAMVWRRAEQSPRKEMEDRIGHE